MHLVAEPHKNIGGARAALPSGRLRLALLGKLVSCHWLSLIVVFQWFGERRKGKKIFFLTDTFSLLHPLSSMCCLCYSRFQEFHQPKAFLTNPTAIPDAKGEASSLQNKIPQKRRCRQSSFPSHILLLLWRAGRWNNNLPCTVKEWQLRKVKSASCRNVRIQIKASAFS